MYKFVLMICLILVSLKIMAYEDISESDYLSNIGNCACPYNLDSAGELCGRRSAWCNKYDYSPACDLNKITKEMVEDCQSKDENK